MAPLSTPGGGRPGPKSGAGRGRRGRRGRVGGPCSHERRGWRWSSPTTAPGRPGLMTPTGPRRGGGSRFPNGRPRPGGAFLSGDAAVRLLTQILLVSVGSALGGLSRWGVTVAAGRWVGDRFPWGTLFINVSGSRFLGWFPPYLPSLGVGSPHPGDPPRTV